LIEELLARKHLVRFWWTDPYRILYELVADTREIDVEALVDDLLRIDDGTLESGLKSLLENHLPLGYYMQGIAERFGPIRCGSTCRRSSWTSAVSSAGTSTRRCGSARCPTIRRARSASRVC